MRPKTPVAVLLGLFLLTAVPVAVGHTEVGVSAECYDQDGSGGEDRVAVDDGGNVDPLSPPDAVAAASAVADPGAADGNGCTAEDNDERKDYLEVHVTTDDGTTQVCYDGTIRTDGGCPTDPAEQ